MGKFTLFHTPLTLTRRTSFMMVGCSHGLVASSVLNSCYQGSRTRYCWLHLCCDPCMCVTHTLSNLQRGHPSLSSKKERFYCCLYIFQVLSPQSLTACKGHWHQTRQYVYMVLWQISVTHKHNYFCHYCHCWTLQPLLLRSHNASNWNDKNFY